MTAGFWLGVVGRWGGRGRRKKGLTQRDAEAPSKVLAGAKGAQRAQRRETQEGGRAESSGAQEMRGTLHIFSGQEGAPTFWLGIEGRTLSGFSACFWWAPRVRQRFDLVRDEFCNRRWHRRYEARTAGRRCSARAWASGNRRRRERPARSFCRK